MCPCEPVSGIHLGRSPQLGSSDILACELVPNYYLHACKHVHVHVISMMLAK
jgi:hypothetical protein